MPSPKIGEIIRVIRIQKGFTQTRLATQAEIKSSSVISEIETGKIEPHLQTLNKILKALNLPSIEQLIQDTGTNDSELTEILNNLSPEQKNELKGYAKCLLERNNLASPPS